MVAVAPISRSRWAASIPSNSGIDMSATMMSGLSRIASLTISTPVMSHSHHLECRLQKPCHSLQHERMVVGQQDTSTILGAFRLSNF